MPRLRWIKRVIAFAVALGVLLIVGVTGGVIVGGVGSAILSLPRTAGTVPLGAAISAPVTVTRDPFGVPTIRAASLNDAFAALGYVHAQDRLWQMEAMRRLGAGRLAEVIGTPGIGPDRFMRTLGLYRHAEAQWSHLAPQTRAVLEAYAGGVNAFLETRSAPLPPEFQLLWLTPEPWRPADTLVWQRLMGEQLAGNWNEELLNARLMAQVKDSGAVAFLTRTEPDGPRALTVASDGGTVSSWSAGVLASLSQAIPDAARERLASNAWAVSAGQTAPGVGAVLASDPHLGFQAPILWYLARLETPDLTLEGATVPGVPFVLIGHNTRVAWGLTTTHSDTKDLYRERLSPDGSGYLTPEGPCPFLTRSEILRVRFGDPRRMTVRETRHGPVVSDLAWSRIQGARAVMPPREVLALASVTLRDEDTTPDALLRLAQAPDLTGARAALMAWDAPQQNIVLADQSGRIALLAPGRVPVRAAGHDGCLPVEGWSGAMDWQGWVPRQALPQVVDPPEGRVLNANNRLHPTDVPYPLAVHFPESWRAERLATRLGGLKSAAAPVAATAPATGPATAEAMAILQTDTVSEMARALLPEMLAAVDSTRLAHPEAKAALALLRDWDPPAMDGARVEPLLMSLWLEIATRSVFADDLGPVFPDWAARPRPWPLRLALTEEPLWCDDIQTPDRRESCDQQITAALDAALRWIGDRTEGAVLSTRWDDWHRARFSHGLFGRIPGLSTLTDLEIPTDGGDFTLNRGAFLGLETQRPFAHVHGPGLRMVVDLGPPARARFILATGQSGHPLSRHYGDQMPVWKTGGLWTIGGTAAKTQSASESLTLTPRGH